MTILETLTSEFLHGETPDQRLINLGVDISKSPDVHNMVSIRMSDERVFYGFKLITDYQAFAHFLMLNQIRFTVPEVSDGARYPYHVKLDIQKETNQTFYEKQTLDKAIEMIQNAKQIIIEAQDFKTYSELRDVEMKLVQQHNLVPTFTDEDLEHLNWMYSRLISVHGENQNYDYMLKMNKILTKLKTLV